MTWFQTDPNVVRYDSDNRGLPTERRKQNMFLRNRPFHRPRWWRCVNVSITIREAFAFARGVSGALIDCRCAVQGWPGPSQSSPRGCDNTPRQRLMYEVINHGTPRSIQTRLEITAPSADNRRPVLSASLRGPIDPVEKVAPQESGVNVELDGVERSLTLGGSNFGRETSRIRVEQMRVTKKAKEQKSAFTTWIASQYIRLRLRGWEIIFTNSTFYIFGRSWPCPILANKIWDP